MTTHAPITTIYDEPCPGCGLGGGVYWLDSAPDTDSWACRHCGHEWIIAVHGPGVA